MLIEISILKGEVPIIDPKQLPLEHAQVAINADLSQNILKPFYEIGDAKTLDTTAWRSIYPIKYSGAIFWLCSEKEISAINIPVQEGKGRICYTDGIKPKETNFSLASNNGVNTYGTPNIAYYVGPPKPIGSFYAVIKGPMDGDLIGSISYIYTFVADWGYESEPSSPTEVVDIKKNQYIELKNFEISPVPSNYNIVGIRIYRTATGTTGTDFQFVSELMTGVSPDYITPAEILANGGIWEDFLDEGVAAQGTITMSGIAVADETFVIDSQTFTWKDTRADTGEVTVGISASEAVTNIVSAVTADLTTVAAIDGDGDTVVITATEEGTSGNSIVFTEDSTYMEMDGAGVLGGTTAGVDDNITEDPKLGEVIPCEDYIQPSDDLKGLISLPNGVTVGYRGKEVYLSEPYIHYGYPIDYRVTTDFDIKSIGWYGTTIVVGTEGYPYKVNGYDPQNVSIEKQPDQQACLFSRATVNGPRFVLYPSPDGLYMISDEGNRSVTETIFTKEQWRDLLSDKITYDKTIVAFLYDEKYYAFFEGTNEGFIIDFKSASQYYVRFKLDSSLSVYGGYVDLIDDTLYLLIKKESTYYIKKWEGFNNLEIIRYITTEAGDNLVTEGGDKLITTGTSGITEDSLVYQWKSKIFVISHAFFSCMKIDGDLATDITGTGTISATGIAIVGDGTSFTTELKVGYPIYNADNKEYREISTITDNTHLTLVSAFSANFSGKAFKYNIIILNIYRDDSLFFTKAINSTNSFRLPSGTGKDWEIEIKGTGKVNNIKMAQAMSELAAMRQTAPGIYMGANT